MKPPRNTPDPRPAPNASAHPASPTDASASAPATPDDTALATAPPDDLSAQLADIEQQELALADRKARLQKAFFDDGITRAKAIVQGLSGRGFELASIAKALGLSSRLASSCSSSRAAGGPTTNAGWFQVFRTRALQQYLKTHPSLAASLKKAGVAPADAYSHVPAEDLKPIDDAAHAKADAKCPAATPVA